MGIEGRVPDRWFRYPEAKILILCESTMTFVVTNREGKQRKFYCSFVEKFKPDLKRAIESDSKVNILIVRYVLAEEDGTKEGRHHIEDWLEQVWRVV